MICDAGACGADTCDVSGCAAGLSGCCCDVWLCDVSTVWCDDRVNVNFSCDDWWLLSDAMLCDVGMCDFIFSIWHSERDEFLILSSMCDTLASSTKVEKSSLQKN